MIPLFFQKAQARRYTLLAVLLLAFALRLYRLEEKDVWWDEGWSVWLARQDLVTIAQITAADEHPPLHYWFLRLWRTGVGEGEYAQRFSSVAFGVLSVVALYVLAAQAFSPGVGALAALLLALARFHVWWSQEIKMYALAILLSLLSLYFFLRLLRGGGLWSWLGYVTVTLSGLYTLYLVGLIVAAQGLLWLWLLLRGPGQVRRLAALGAAAAALVLLYLPWLYLFLTQARLRTASEPFELGLFLELYATVLSLGIATDLHLYRPGVATLWLVAAMGLLWGLTSRQEEAQRGTLLLGLSLILMPLALYALSLPQQAPFHPKIAARYLVLFSPFYVALAALGVVAVGRFGAVVSLLPAGLVLGAALFTLVDYHDSRHRSSDVAALASYLEARARPGDAIVMNPDHDWPVYAYHLKGSYVWHQLDAQEIATPEKVDYWLVPLPQQSPTVWLITTQEAASTDPQGQVPRWLQQRYQEVESRTYGQTRLILFSREADRDFAFISALPRERLQLQEETLGDLTLVGFERLAAMAQPGDRLYVTTYWRGRSRPPQDFRVGLELRDGAGSLVFHRAEKPLLKPGAGVLWEGDAWLQGQDRLTIGPSVQPGTYQLSLRVRSPQWGLDRLLPLQRVRVAGEGPHATPPTPQVATEAILGGSVRLLGYDLAPSPAQPGDALRLTLYWQAMQEMETSYTVFVHLLDSAGRLRDQRDLLPQGGRAPTTGWSVGEIVPDAYAFPMKEEYRGQALSFSVGLYDATRSLRLPLTDAAGRDLGANSIALGPLRVK